MKQPLHQRLGADLPSLLLRRQNPRDAPARRGHSAATRATPARRSRRPPKAGAPGTLIRELTRWRISGRNYPLNTGFYLPPALPPKHFLPGHAKGGSMRFAGLVAAFLIAFATLTPPARAQSVLSPDFAATNAGALADRGGRARDLDVRHRLQRPLLHLHLPAAARRRDRLVRDPARRAPGRPVPGLGRDPRPGLLRARRPRLPGAVGDGDLRLPVVPGRRRAARLRRPRGLPRPGLRFRGRALRRLDPARRDRPAPGRLRPLLRHLDRRARPPQVPEPALRRRRLGGDRRLGGLRRLPLRRPGEPRQPAQPALGRLGRAAVPHRHGLRRLPHRLRPAEPAGRPRRSRRGRTSTPWSATSTAASRTCSAAACRRTGSSGS